MSISDLANRGIVGIAPGPWKPDDGMHWPTEGYDSPLYAHQHGENYDRHGLAASGHTRAEWVALADEMIARWAAWKVWVEQLPPAVSSRSDDPAPPSAPPADRREEETP